MRTILISGIAILSIFVLVGLFGCTSMSPTANTKTVFSTSAYANGVKVAPGIASLSAREALGELNVIDSLLQDGNDQITITGGTLASPATNPFILPKGSSLYFYDGNPSDDIGGADRNPSDDIFVLVNENGYIIQVMNLQ